MPPETTGAGHRRLSAPRWPVPVLPLTLMIIVALTGLHGGPVPVGIALVAVLVITTHRLVSRASAGTVETAPASAVAVKLRRVLVFWAPR